MMKKILGLVILLAFTVTTLAAFLFLNFQLGLLSGEKIKEAAARSNVYEFTAAFFRESLAKETESSVGDGPLLEILTDAVNGKTVKEISEAGIDNFSLTLKDPKANPKVILPTKKLGERVIESARSKFGGAGSAETEAVIAGLDLGAPFDRDTAFNLGANPAILILSKEREGLIILFALSILLLVPLFLMPARETGKRFIWAGSGFFLSGAALFGASAVLYYFLPVLLRAIYSSLEIESQKITTGTQKFIELLAGGQETMLVVEAAGLLLLGTLLISLGRSLKEEKVDILKEART